MASKPRKLRAPQFAPVVFTKEQEKAWPAWAGEVSALCYKAGISAKQMFGVLKAPDVRDDEFVRGVTPKDFASRVIALKHMIPH